MLSSKFDAGRNGNAKLPMPGITGSFPVPSHTPFPSQTSQHFPVPMSSMDDPDTTSKLPVIHSSSSASGTLSTGRLPVVIPGMGRNAPSTAKLTPVQTKHRVIIHASVVFVLFVFIATSLITFLPLGKDGQALGFSGLLQSLGAINMVNSTSKNSAQVAAQAATATAITTDGFDAGSANAQYNALLGAPGTDSADWAELGRFIYGQCTYWANMRYHQLTGYWIPWSGNAYQWSGNAAAYSPPWIISSKPNPNGPSIMVFQPGVQYASWAYGHVAIVEKINADGSVLTSNWNVVGYPFATEVDLTNYVTAGTAFVWHK